MKSYNLKTWIKLRRQEAEEEFYKALDEVWDIGKERPNDVDVDIRTDVCGKKQISFKVCDRKV